MILGLNPDSILETLSSKPPGLQRNCMILGLNLNSVFGSWSCKKKDETNVYKCLQKLLIHDAKLILEILLFGSLSSEVPGLDYFCMLVGLNPGSVLGSLSSKPPGLQRICMILGLNLGSVFGSWFYKKKDETNADKCLQKPRIHDAKLILEILLFESWPSKPAGLECFCMILGLNPDSVLETLSSKSPGLQRIYMILGLSPDSILGSLSSKPAGSQRICMILGLNLDSICGSWSFKKKDETNVYKSL